MKNKTDIARKFYSIGYVCQQLQILPDQLTTIMDEKNLAYSMTIDGVGMLDGETLLKVADTLDEIFGEIDNVAKRAALN